MSDPLPWYALAVATTLLNGCALGFIAWRENNLSLRSWALAWLSWGAAVAPLAALGSPEAHPLLAVLFGLLWVISTLLFLRGAYGFGGRSAPRVWFVVAAVCVLLALSLGVGPTGPAGMVPLVLFQSVGLCAAGVVIIRRARARAGAWLSGCALFGLGLHVLDAPLAASDPTLLRWGFVLAIALQVLAALGMLMLYYEHVRSDLVDTQQALEQVRRIEALGRVAGGVAHDFNNLLMVMQGHLDLLRARGEHNPNTTASLAAIEGAVERAGRLTSQLLAFGRRSPVRPEAIDVQAVVAETLELLARVIPERIRLELTSDAGPFVTVMDQALLEQIVLNLVTNARDAITGHGTVRVQLERTHEPPVVILRVTDDGGGIPDDLVGRIFEPFVTSKPPGAGTGLGLASVQGAVGQLGGRIWVESAVGRGSTFHVELPWRARRPAAARRRQGPGKRNLAILVADDDEDVRTITVGMLAVGGHHAEAACDGEEALEKIRARPYDLVISDLVMPRMGGRELLEAIGRVRPDTALVVTSGYPQDDDMEPMNVHFLAKPFGQRQLLELVDRVASDCNAGSPPCGSDAATG